MSSVWWSIARHSVTIGLSWNKQTQILVSVGGSLHTGSSTIRVDGSADSRHDGCVGTSGATRSTSE